MLSIDQKEIEAKLVKFNWNFKVGDNIRHNLEEVFYLYKIKKESCSNTREKQFLNKHISITDFRSYDNAPEGNRFLVYTLFSEAVANVRIRYDDPGRQSISLSVGHNIFNPKCNVNVGKMLSKFGGGGHKGAGACRFLASKAGEYIPQIISTLIENRPEE